MMFYILVLPAIALNLYYTYTLLKLKAHDRVLFRFCQLRRDVIKYISENGNDLSSQEYKDIRYLLDNICNTIHYFDDHKKHIFTFKVFNEIFNEFKTKIKKASIKSNKFSNEEIYDFYLKFGSCINSAFMAYVPLLRYRLFLKILFLLLELGTIAGIKQMVKLKNNLKWYFDNQPENKTLRPI